MDVSELLKKVRRIEIVAKRSVDDLFAGQYKSVFRGRGMEFSEVREYQPGDDIRSIDWNVTARAGRPYIKQFVEERELTILFLVDVSASGVFGSHRSKLEIAVEVAAMLMFSALKNNDKVGLITFADQVVDFFRPRKGKANVLRLIRQLLTVQPIAKPTNLKTVLDYVNRVQKRRAVVFLLSDFLVPELLGAEPDEFEDFSHVEADSAVNVLMEGNTMLERTMLLRSVRGSKRKSTVDAQERALSICSRKHDLVAMKLSDPREKEFPDVGFLTLRDAETGQSIEIDTADPAVRDLLAKHFRLGRQRIDATLRRCRIDQLNIETRDDFLGDLRQFFHSREKRLH